MVKYSVNEFADLVGVDRKTLYNWDRSGKLVADREISGKKFYTDEHIKTMMLWTQEG